MNKDPESTERRLVLKRLGQAGLVLGGSGAIAALGAFSSGRWRGDRKLATIADHRVEPSPGSALAVARGTDPARLVRASLAAIGGMERFVRPGDTVLLKPNMAWDRTVEQGANTHPAIVAEVARLCLAARAKRVIVAEVPVHDAARVAERSGIRKAALEAGAEVLIPPDAGFVDTALSGATLDHWEVFAPLFLADRVINLPIVKDHALTRFTCGLKNWYGLLGGTRARLHQDIHHAIADVAGAVRPTLTVVDATRVMVRGGPTGGRLEDVRIENAVAAGTDAVALDAWGAGLLGLDPFDIPYLMLAEGRGLGSIRAGMGRIEEIRVGA
jgi:uncharacterized protein (DUF362 family)